jgi:diaminopimelate decarboxylase
VNDTAKPMHAPMTQFPVVGDCLTVGGIAVTRLAARVGQTPFYVYDRRLLSERVVYLRRHLPPEVHLHYAIKANPMPAVVQHMAGLMDGLDVASARELMVALDTTMNAANISFAGPGKSDAEVTRAVAAGIVLNLESERELASAIQAGERLGITPKVAVRVNPDFELRGSSMKMGGGAKQFGVDADRVRPLLARIGVARLDFAGFHIYSGSQNLKAEAIIEAQAKTLDLAYHLAKDAPGPVKTVNIGGGFGIPYFPGEVPLDLAAIGAALAERLLEAKARLPEARVVVELGRYLVGEAGVYICRVTDRKISRGQVFLVTDGGMHHHLSASGNFGQVIRKNYPVAVATRMLDDEREIATVVGPLCTPLDLLGDKMYLARADVGDLIVVFQSGAYGLTASPLKFLSHPEPLEILV